MSIRDELDRRQAQRDILAWHFGSHPREVVTRDTLRELVGENYRSRIAECRTRGMHIENVPQFKADGTRGYGAYRYLPQAPLGRPAEQPVATTLFDIFPRA